MLPELPADSARPARKDASGQPDTPAPLTSPPSGLDYAVVRLIGRGGYGEVWLVRDQAGGYCACKVIYRVSFDHERPYEREYDGIRKFEPVSRANESQVKILHVGRRDQAGYFYYLMELADDANAGREIDPHRYVPRTLKSELVRRGRLPLSECVQIGLSLSAALENLHRNGLIHRDIKPANVIFVNGFPKLADIGLVTELDVSVSYVGTEGYIPPEGPTSAQADVYGLGKVLYELSTGRDRQEFPELPTDFGAQADQQARLEFNAIVTRACEGDLRTRYRSAREFHADLALLQSGGSVRHRRAARRRWKWAGRLSLPLAGCLLGAWAISYFQKRPLQVEPAALPVTVAAARIPLPNAQQLALSQTELRESLKQELAGQGPQSVARLARELLVRSAAAPNPVRELASLRLSSTLATEAGDFALAMDACAKMAERFQMDTLPVRVELLTRGGQQPRSAENSASLAEACLVTGFDAIALDDYESAATLAGVGEPAAKLAASSHLTRQIGFLRDDISRCRSEFERVKPFLEALRRHPGEPEASLQFGDFLCFTKNDGEAGLPMLAHGNNAALTAVVESELAQRPVRLRDQITTGDSWWKLAAAAPAQFKSHFQQRARYWYLRGVGQAKGPEKARLRQQLADKIPVPTPAFSEVHLFSRVNEIEHIVITGDEIRWRSTRGSLNNRINRLRIGDLPAGGMKVIKNCGATRLLFEGVDFRTARLTINQKAKRRGKATLEVAEDRVHITLQDQPMGYSDLEVTITFGEAHSP